MLSAISKLQKEFKTIINRFYHNIEKETGHGKDSKNSGGG